MEGEFQAERHTDAKKGRKAGEDLGLFGNCLYSAEPGHCVCVAGRGRLGAGVQAAS